MRNKTKKKSFALIYERNGNLFVNLMSQPLEADFLGQAFKDITPGYHVNKVHWNTVTLGGDVPDEQLQSLIERSYDLIKPKIRERRNIDAF